MKLNLSVKPGKFSCVEDIITQILQNGYGSDSPTSNEENNETFALASQELDARSVCKVYLITYSQMEEELFPTRRSFVNAVFQSFTDSSVVQWCCCLEQHISVGVHYHMVIKLGCSKWWISCKIFFQDSCEISVHFSEIHSNYYSAWKYSTKKHKHYIQGLDHPDLTNVGPPRMTMACIAIQTKRKKRAKHFDMDNVGHIHGQVSRDSDVDNNKAKRRKKQMTSYELSEIALAKNMKSRTELLALAKQQKVEGKTDIAEFIVTQGAEVVSEVLDTAWEMEHSTDDLEKAGKSRVQLLHEVRQGECREGYSGQWLASVEVVLERN